MSYIIITVVTILGIILAIRNKKKPDAKKEELKIVGFDPKRTIKVQQALTLILQSSFESYVKQHLDIIQKDDLSGVSVSKIPVIFHLTNKYVDSVSVKWLASVFVHESRHVEKHRSGETYSGIKSELDANRYQLVALKQLKGSKKEIEFLRKQDGSHFDTNGDGILDHNDNWGY